MESLLPFLNSSFFLVIISKYLVLDWVSEYTYNIVSYPS